VKLNSKTEIELPFLYTPSSIIFSSKYQIFVSLFSLPAISASVSTSSPENAFARMDCLSFSVFSLAAYI